MSIPILATKLYLPLPRPNMILRPRLSEQLDAGLHRKLILVSAAAGFGKTTLVSNWISDFLATTGGRPEAIAGQGKVGNRVAWLSLDEGDSDPVRFLAYLVAALQTIKADLGENILSSLQSSQPPPIEVLLTTLLNEITAIPDHFILTLDDYHLMDSRPVDEALAFLLERMPSQMHLVISTREDPPLPLARLRARGQLTELRAADLRFSPGEAAEFLNQSMGLNLSEVDVTALEARTEGWIAGLQLAALAMQGEKDTSGFIQSFTGSHHFVLDYLLEEVLQRQPPDIQNFLLRTSILKQMCAPLCDTVLDTLSTSSHQPSTIVLETLERANLFLVPLDKERRWYRYHHLFSDLLNQRLGQNHTPDEIAQYHIRASEWHEKHGQADQAFHHAISGEDFERAASQAEMAWPGMEETFQSAEWLGWVKKLPESAILARPLLCFQLGRALSDAGQPESSEIHLKNAERALAESPSRAGAEFAHISGEIALTRAYNAQVQGDAAGTVQYAEQALQCIPAEDFFRRAQAAIMLEFTHWASGDLEACLRAIHAWMADMRKLGNLAFEIASVFAVADLLMALGRLNEAEKALRQAIAQTTGQGEEIEAITTHHHLGLALLAHERGQDKAAAHHLQTAAALGQRTTLVDWPHRWMLAQARFKESNGEWDAALTLLDEARRAYVKNPVPITRPVEAMQARIHLKQGQRHKVEKWAQERGISLTDEVNYQAEFELLTLARLEIANPQGNALLERLLTFAEAQKRMGSVLDILLTQTLAHKAQNNLHLALASLERALNLAQPEGYLRVFVDEGEIMRLMISDFRFSIDEHPHPLLAYVDKLLAAFPQSEIPNPKSEIEILSPRELEILRLVAQGLSNHEISQRLFLALSTVKGHNLRIFAKLQAQNRTEAVARARELGLL